MDYTFHYYLRKSLSWYDNWHNHPHHQYVHWFGVFVFLLLTSVATSVQMVGLHIEKNQAQAQTAPTLGMNGERFTVNGQQRFLVFVSYFDAFDAADLAGDLSYLRARGIDGIRIFPIWFQQFNPTVDNPVNAFDGNGTLNPAGMARLRTILDAARAQGMIVDISFTCDEIMTSNTCRDGIRNVVDDLGTGYPHMFYDLNNEAEQGPSGSNRFPTWLAESHIRELRDHIKNNISQNIIVTTSYTTGTQGSIAFTNRMGLDVFNTHGPLISANPNWWDEVYSYALSFVGSGRPHYMGETRSVFQYPATTTANMITAITEAKRAGAAAYNFHTEAGFYLHNFPNFQSALTSVESAFMDQFLAPLNATSWGSGGGPPTPTPPPGGGVTGTYQGQCPAGYIAIAGGQARASSWTQDTPTLGIVCDEDGIFNDPNGAQSFGVTYPTQALLHCGNEGNAGTAFITTSGPCNSFPSNPASRPGWRWDPGTGQPIGVNLIATAQCGPGGGSANVTLNNANFSAGAWTSSPNVTGEVCVPGTLITRGGSAVTITSITPNSAPEGATVTITGTNLDQCEPVYAGANLDPRCNVMFFDLTGTRSTVSGTQTSSTSVTAIVAAGLCTGAGSVRVGSVMNPSNALTFTVVSGTGTNCTPYSAINRFIYYIYPDRAPAGAPITVAGYNLDTLVHFYSANGTETTATGIVTGLSNSVSLTGVPNGVPTYVSVNIPATLAPGAYMVRVGPSASDLSNEFGLTVTPDTYVPAPASSDPPTITGISPTTVSQGGTIEIYGDNLPANVSLTDNISSQVTDITGWVNNDKNIVTVGISFNVLPGQYTVSVSGPNGSATSPNMLTVTESTNPVNPQSTDIVVPQAINSFEELISGSLSYAVYGLGIAVFVMILYAGFLWMTSAANPGNIALAKRYMTNAIIGAVLLLSSYIILYTINPDLVGGTLSLPGIQRQR